MMNVRRCLYCYQELTVEKEEFHASCSRKIFGKTTPPVLEYSVEQMHDLAEKIIQTQAAVTGVQAKLSLGIRNSSEKNAAQKLTIMGVYGDYILKPPSEHYPSLPELEDVTMHLASISGIETVPHTLVRLLSGELAYLTKRIDRKGKVKFHMEDMCQLTDRLTEAKYRGSYEQIAKAIIKYATNPGFDVINFFEQVIFSFLTGNSDMHLKNFSLFKDPKIGYRLSPAYDLVASQLVVIGDDEELALNLNGKKKKIKKNDFEMATKLFEIDPRALQNTFNRFKKAIPKWHAFIDISFLPEEMKDRYHVMVDKKVKQLEL